MMIESLHIAAPPLWHAFCKTRARFLDICRPLNVEDHALQAEAFTSPPKWHLAHTTWFFETFLLKPFLAEYQAPEPMYEVLFNSYYNGVGEQFPRPQRGLLSRPTLGEVLDYRRSVEAALETLVMDSAHPQRATISERLRLGIEHEQQHQELFFTDLKHSLAVNPLRPCYTDATAPPCPDASVPTAWNDFPGGLVDIGYEGGSFCFDNELPRHRSFLQPFSLASRLVTNGEYAAFIADGGYQRPELWLADGWATVQAQGWQAPHYWVEQDGESLEFTLHGLRARSAHQPVCHVSGYEAEAFARWSRARLPTEQEWEFAARSAPGPAQDARADYHHPLPAGHDTPFVQLYDSCWQWTRSAYAPYPGYAPSAGAIGEYNGKFMSNQWVLRGGSCVSPPEQLRPSYRNFFYPQDRWQFTGIRLARDLQ